MGVQACMNPLMLRSEQYDISAKQDILRSINYILPGKGQCSSESGEVPRLNSIWGMSTNFPRLRILAQVVVGFEMGFFPLENASQLMIIIADWDCWWNHTCIAMAVVAMILIVLLQVNRSQARNFALCTSMVIRPITSLKYCHLIGQNRLSIYSMKVIIQKWYAIFWLFPQDKLQQEWRLVICGKHSKW